MRFALATVALFAASASASSVLRRQTIPACASACLASANTSDCPDTTDDACLCTSQAFISSIVACFQSSCQAADLTSAEQAGEQLCAAAGVTLSNLPTGSATAAPTTAGNSTASGSVSVSTSVSSVTSVSRSVSTSVVAPVTSATSPVSVSKSVTTSTTVTPGTSSGSAAPASSSKSAGSIIGVSAFAGLAAFGLAALTL